MTSDYKEILRRLESVKAMKQRIALLNGLYVCLFVACFLVVDAVMLERAFSFGIAGRTILFLIVIVVLLGSLAWFVGLPLLRVLGIMRSATFREIALTVGNHFSNVRDRLLNAIQMVERESGSFARYSPELIDAAFADVYRDVKNLDFAESVDVGPVRRIRKFTSYAVGVFLLVVLLSPSGFLSSVHRILHFGQAFAAPVPVEFVVAPGDVEVVRGATVPLSIRTVGKPVQTLSLHTRRIGRTDFETRELSPSTRPGGQPVFQDSISSIKESTEYFVETESIRSKTFTIIVVDRPVIRSLTVGLQFPLYTRLPAKALEKNIGDISAYPGTIVALEVSTNKELDSAEVIFQDGVVLPMNVQRSGATGTFVLRGDGSYRLRVRDREGLSNADPIEYRLSVVPDAFPTVAVVAPGKNVDVNESMRFGLLIRIADDFGFSKLQLAYKLTQSRYERPADVFSVHQIPFSMKDGTKQDLWYQWDLTGMNLVPEDVVSYYVEVFDNDDINGPKSARSETYLVRLPSLDEVFRDVAQTQSQSLESLQSSSSDLQQVKKQIEELQAEMKTNKADPKDASRWQQQKKVEAMQKQFEELRKKLDEAARKIDENVQRMQDNKMLSAETLEKFLELQKVMEELNAPELQQALKRLQESMKQLSPDQIREAMQKVQMTEELLRKSLERTIELLKRIAVEQKMDELLKRTQELIRQQEDIRQQSEQATDRQKLDELSQRQEDLQKQLDAMRKELGDLRKRMEEFPNDMPLDEVRGAQDELEQQQLGSEMQNAARQMQQGQKQKAQASQQKVSQGLQKFLDRMSAAQQSMRENQQRQVMREMKRALQNILELSGRQEELKSETQGLDPNSQRIRDNAQEQMEILSDLVNVTNSLAQLSKKTFAIAPEMGREIGKAMQQMHQAIQGMEQRNSVGSAQSQSEAMASLNRTAMLMQNAMNNGMQGGGVGMAGLMQQLQQMSGMQAGINAQSQSMSGEGQGVSPQQAAEWARLAGEQGAVRKSLEELAREARETGEIQKLLGDLNKIAQDMQEVQTDMEQNNVNPETLKKQERILSRLLDSQRSMRERDYEKRRRAEAGKNVVRSGPADIDFATQEGRSKLRQELLKVLEQRYTRDYEELIRKYFEELEKEDIEQ